MEHIIKTVINCIKIQLNFFQYIIQQYLFSLFGFLIQYVLEYMWFKKWQIYTHIDCIWYRSIHCHQFTFIIHSWLYLTYLKLANNAHDCPLLILIYKHGEHPSWLTIVSSCEDKKRLSSRSCSRFEIEYWHSWNVKWVFKANSIESLRFILSDGDINITRFFFGQKMKVFVKFGNDKQQTFLM